MTLSQDTIFHTLSNERRRSVIRVLATNERMTVRELTGAVAAIEYEMDADQLDYRQRKRVYTSLVQTHLPSMASHGIVDYDKDRGVVTAKASLGTFAPYLDDGATVARSQAATLLSLTAVFGVLSVLLAVDAPVVGSLPGFAIALAATLGVGSLAVRALRRGQNGPADGATQAAVKSRERSGVVDVSKQLLFFWR